MNNNYELPEGTHDSLEIYESCDNNSSEPIIRCGNVNFTTEPTCISILVTPKVIPASNVIVKMPVLLTELMIQIPIIADIELHNESFEIKRIKKNVYLTQCKVLPQFNDNGFVSNMGLLVIEGFVRKNIEYATIDCNTDELISGDVQHTTVKVPFSCTTPVTFIRLPMIARNLVTSELELFQNTLRSCDPCAEPIIGKEPCEQSFFNNEFFNEKIFCELVSADIVEADIHKNPTPLPGQQFCENPTEQVFRQIREKMVVRLTLKILQNQQVKISSLGSDKPECSQ